MLWLPWTKQSKINERAKYTMISSTQNSSNGLSKYLQKTSQENYIMHIFVKICHLILFFHLFHLRLARFKPRQNRQLIKGNKLQRIRSLILILFIESELLYREFSASCVILKFIIKSAPYIIKLYLAGNWKSWLERSLFEAF